MIVSLRSCERACEYSCVLGLFLVGVCACVRVGVGVCACL